ncbi:MAG: hypothetical protein JW904_07555 [Spirochaetales bacterium]|nr:hypothetical protein [Spirochaetales bacterium]
MKTRIVKRLLLLLLFLMVFAVSLAAESRPKILLLPLINKGGTTSEECEQTTKQLGDKMQELNLFDLVVAPDWLSELNLQEYEYYNEQLKTKIRALGNFDYIIAGYVFRDAAAGNYTLAVVITNFKGRTQEYNKAFHGWSNLSALIGSQIDSLKNFKGFLPDQAAIRTRYLDILRKYSPDTYPIIDALMKKKSNFDVLDFILTSESLALGMDTAVHEGNHAYARISGKANLHLQYINPRETVEVPLTETFPSKELTTVIPGELRTFRFNTYVAAVISDTSTQSEGIYGLLNEFNSYYQGLHTVCELLPYFKSAVFSDNPGTYNQYLRPIYADYFAYYEFRFFIETYLLYAQKKHTEVFDKIMKNKNFLSAFRKLDAAWRKLLGNIAAIESEVHHAAMEYGVSVRREGKSTYIGLVGSRGIGMANYQETIDLLSEELKKDEYQALEQVLFQ